MKCSTALLALAVAASCRSVVPVHEEPLHRPVHEGAGFRVLDVRIPPGVVSGWHEHDAPITYVSIDASPMDVQEEGGSWRGTPPDADPPWERGEHAWTLDYAQAPLVHRVTNVGSEPFRVIAIVNHGAGDADAPPSGVGRAEASCPWFVVSRVTLPPQDGLTWEAFPLPAVVVQVTEGQARVGGREASEPGAFFVRDAAEPWELRNTGASEVELLVVELR